MQLMLYIAVRLSIAKSNSNIFIYSVNPVQFSRYKKDNNVLLEKSYGLVKIQPILVFLFRSEKY